MRVRVRESLYAGVPLCSQWEYLCQVARVAQVLVSLVPEMLLQMQTANATRPAWRRRQEKVMVKAKVQAMKRLYSSEQAV